MINGWAESVEILSGVSRKHLQSEYAGLQKSLQQEWAFVEQVTPVFGNTVVPAETAMKETFVPEFFKGLGNGVP